MIAQSDLVDEIKVGIEDLLRRVIAQHLDEQGDDALHDQRIAVGGEHQPAIHHVALEPHAALTAVDEVLLGLIFIVEGFEVIAQVNQHLVLVHPVVEVAELSHHLVLQFINRFHLSKCYLKVL